MARFTPAAASLCFVISAVAGTAHSAEIFTDFNIFQPVFTQVYNDRIGNSRLFGFPNTDRVRVSVFASPSPDTDVFGVVVGPDRFRSLNGSDTTVTFNHPSFPGVGAPVQPTTFIGLTSGLGGGRNEYTRTFDRANPVVASLLPSIDSVPLVVTVSNPRAPGANSVTYNAPDFNKDALPPFVTDLKFTGGGLNPTLDWAIPTSGGLAPNNVSLQIRRIDAESADRTRITASKLVHVKSLPAGTTSYTINETFSNAGFAGFPSGLEEGRRYEISVQLENFESGALKGRSRTFFEFAPLPAGLGNVAVFLPSVGPNGVFKFDIEVKPGEQILLDPFVAIGYEYQVGTGDPFFASVTPPDIGDGLFDLYLFDGTDWFFEEVLSAGNEFLFAPGGVDRFRILGIETSAGIDPSDTTAFITALTFSGAGRFTGTMTPITAFVVPEPGSIALLALALAALAASRLRQIRPSGDSRRRHVSAATTCS